jgi:hypothetical protein
MGGKWKAVAAGHLRGTRHVRYWPKADMSECTAHVRFRGQSGHSNRADGASNFDLIPLFYAPIFCLAVDAYTSSLPGRQRICP